MTTASNSTRHDAYAAGYDQQVQAYDCFITDVLFGLVYEFTTPGQLLLDVGVGSGLSSQLFARTGMEIHGMDFSSEFLRLCRIKGFCASLTRHDATDVPWPYQSHRFDHVVCCGVMHFIPNLEGIFAEAGRVLRSGGWFTFTSRVAPQGVRPGSKYTQQNIGDFEIFDHAPGYLDALIRAKGFIPRKTQKCLVGEDVFSIQVVQKTGNPVAGV